MILNFIINLNPIAVLLLGITYLALLISAVLLVLKNESGLMLFVWLIISLSIPFVGPALYITKYFMAGKAKLQS